ncbi:MAG: alpha/beta hydrolase [Alphaproteobacteria bacterium]
MTQLDGVEIFTRWWRPAEDDGPVLVFLHDGLGCTDSLRDFPDALAGALGLGAFGYDRWGYGRSAARPELPVDLMEDCAARLPRLLEAAGIDDYAVIGHSDGGTIALLHAMTNPPGLHATVSIAAHVHDDDASTARLARHGTMAAAGKAPDWLVRFHGEKARATRLMAEWVRVWRASFDAGWDLTERLGEIQGPLLALHGAADDYGLAGQLATIAAAVPHAETLLLPGLGHFPHLEDEAAVVTRVAEFLRPLI